MSEPFRVVTPHREGCEGEWVMWSASAQRASSLALRCCWSHPTQAGHRYCNARAVADLPALLAENAELRAELETAQNAFVDAAVERDMAVAEVGDLRAERARALCRWRLSALATELATQITLGHLREAVRDTAGGK